MQKRIAKVIESAHNMRGFRGTIQDIEKRLGFFMGVNGEASLSKFEEDNSIDIGYVASLGMIGETYLDFDIFMLETVMVACLCWMLIHLKTHPLLPQLKRGIQPEWQ